jgi:hypothetical protein
MFCCFSIAIFLKKGGFVNHDCHTSITSSSMTFIGRTEEQGGDIVLIKRFGSWFPFVILAAHVSKLVLVPSSFVGMAGSNSIKRRVGARQCYLLGVVQ